MRLCLFETDTDPARPRLGLLQGSSVIDVHAACAVSMADSMTPKRAGEIARSLCPSDLWDFLENGTHGWNAIGDSLTRLGDRLAEDDLVAPTGERVVHHLADLRIASVVPWRLRLPTAGGTWHGVPIAQPGRTAAITLHTDGRAYLPEYLAVIGTDAEALSLGDAWDCVALVAETRPNDPIDAAVLRTPDELGPDDDLLHSTVAHAIVAASHRTPLLIGDVVRTGLDLMTNLVDDTEIDLRTDRASTVDHLVSRP